MTSRDWEQIANYESYELIKSAYWSLHGRTPGTQHAREIAAPFSHARSYFRSARDAELTVKPLLLYYGVISLSRGLTLLMSRGLREAALTPSHGLSIKEWATSLSGEKPAFLDLTMVTSGGGSFRDLDRATASRSLLRGGSSAVNLTYTAKPLNLGIEFTLGQLLSRQPALREHFVRWKNDTDCAPLEVSADAGSDQAYIKILKYGKTYLTRAIADQILRGTPFQFVQEDDSTFMYQGPNKIEELSGLTDHPNHNFLGIGDLWLVTELSSGHKFSKISALFAISYALGMLVRYFPTQWTALIRGQIEDAALPTLAAAVELIEATYPAVVIDFLEERRDE